MIIIKVVVNVVFYNFVTDTFETVHTGDIIKKKIDNNVREQIQQT